MQSAAPSRLSRTYVSLLPVSYYEPPILLPTVPPHPGAAIAYAAYARVTNGKEQLGDGFESSHVPP